MRALHSQQHRLGAIGAGSVLLLGSVLTFAAPATAAPTATRYQGADRYATAAASFNAVPGTKTTAVLAGGGDFPDALSANYLAGRLGTGTLLTRADTLSPATAQAIDAANVTTVYVVGGTTAVSNAVVSQVRAIDNDDAPPITVTRLGGDNRYETNADVNEAAAGLGEETGAVPRALVASGQGFADALALGPLAYRAKAPLVLTPGAALGEEARAQLALLKRPVDLAGSSDVVSTTTVNQIRSATGSTVTRLGGADRSATAVEVARYATTSTSYSPLFTNKSLVGLTNGLGFADAVGAGPVAGSQGAALLLTRNATAPGAATDYASTVRSDSARVLAFGGADVLPETTVSALLRALTPPAAG